MFDNNVDDVIDSLISPLPNTLLTPLHPNISIHILYTLLRTFSEVLTRRICFQYQSKTSFKLEIISFFLVTLMIDSWVIFFGEIWCKFLSRVKGLNSCPNKPILLLGCVPVNFH